MIPKSPLWGIAQSIPKERADRLISWESFEAIVAQLSKAQVIDFAWEAFSANRLKSCRRAAFLLRVSPDEYDAFFNAPVGYRAQFANSIQKGELANKKLFAALEENLLTFSSNSATVPKKTIAKSLHTADAKFWIYEEEVSSQLGREVVEILYVPWQEKSTNGVGLLAPIGQILEVKGGWLDGQGDEQRDETKKSRSLEIHEVGFS